MTQTGYAVGGTLVQYTAPNERNKYGRAVLLDGDYVISVTLAPSFPYDLGQSVGSVIWLKILRPKLAEAKDGRPFLGSPYAIDVVNVGVGA